MLNTESIKVGGPSKTLEPGNATVTIRSAVLEPTDFKPGAMHLILNVEGPDLGDSFEGFYIDKDQPDLGRYAGPIGKVKMGAFPFADFKNDKVDIKRDNEIMKAVKGICLAIKAEAWWDAQNNKHPTIESLVEQFNTDKPFRDVELDMCIAGEEYTNKAGYQNFDLSLPKYAKGKVPFELAGTNSGKLIIYDPAIHHTIRKPKGAAGTTGEPVKNVEKFGADIPEEKKTKVKKKFEL